MAGLISCQKEDNVQALTNDTFIFTSVKPGLDNETGTKTEWTGSTIQWSAGDNIRMAYTVDGVWQGASDESTTPKLYASTSLESAASIASFTVSGNFKSTATGTHVFYSLYPSALSASDFSNAPVASITIPAEQTPAANSFDAAADVMTGVSEEFSERPSTAILLTWTRQVAHADLTIKNLTINSGETIQRIILTGQEGADLVGMHSINLVTGAISNPQGATNEITINATNLTYEGNSIKVWASFLPVTLTALTVTVETDKAYYVRSFSGFTREFKRNMHNTMNIGMSTATRTEKDLNLGDYEEKFSSNQGDFTINNQSLPGELTYVWTHDSYGYEKGSAYKSGQAYGAISYLISPELEIGSANSKLTFDQAANFLNGNPFGNYFTVVVLEGSTETPLTLDVTPAGNSWNWYSTTVNLGAYKGHSIKIAFKYTSTSSVAGTWEIKNFKVTDVVVPVPDPVINVTTSTPISVANTASTDNSIEYSIANPVSGVSLNATTTASWIENISVTSNQVTFDVAANTGGARSGVITLSYTGATDVEVTVNQESSLVSNTYEYLFNSKSWGATRNGIEENWLSGMDGYQYNTDNKGIQVTATYSGANGTSSVSFIDIETIEVKYCTNASSGAGVIKVTVGDGTTKTFTVSKPSSGGTTLKTASFSYPTQESGKVKIEVECSSNSIFINSATIKAASIVLPTSYSITCASVSNGTISASHSSATEGTEITLTASPATGYKLISWDVQDAEGHSITVANNKFTMPANNVTVSALFNLIPVGDKTYTITWNSTNNSQGLSNYTSTWSVSADGLECSMVNWNNNNNGWNYVKAGRKNYESVASIISPQIPERIKTVTLTIDAVTAANINSLKLFVSATSSFDNATEYSFTPATGDQSVTITTPTNNCYYKIVADCASGSSNGLITVSKLVFSTN